ncbi:uncharacterized protein LOC115699960 [Cannabis sativa]|uniref:uncharacterized protein LOC115699960 n=1 Tax=Cannabis sativa TaxID=3483 RepID=UPI0029C9C78E|nr:uncharacterized protein LOC115699960 [Cannabis sativa]
MLLIDSNNPNKMKTTSLSMEERLLEINKLRISHFSHDHPLTQTNSPPNENCSCSACNLKIISSVTAEYYTCKTCSFSLHQVCYNMPKKTQHPSHPIHHLTLQTTCPSSSSKEGTFECKACGDHINGGVFYYSCAECGLYYHILCSALPLTISVSSHLHELKLTFSSPYNFSCDICTKPSYKGWLYRCQLCEFDAHLLCAISNRRTTFLIKNRILPLPNSSNRQINIKSSSVNYNSEVEEVIQLVIQGVVEQSSVSSCSNFNSDSPKENLTITSTVGFAQTDSKLGFSSANPGKQHLNQSPLTLVSEDLSTTPSTQFSDACFSIDLAKSYSGYNHARQARIEASNSINIQAKSGDIDPKVEDKNNIIIKQEKRLNYGIGSSNHIHSFNFGRDERLKQAFLVRNDTLAKEEAYIGQKGKKKSKAISDTKVTGGSSWQKLILCCHTTS